MNEVVAVPPAPAAVTQAAVAHCKNCGTVLLGRFCSNCSQAAEVHVPSTRELLHDMLEGLTHSDSRLVGSSRVDLQACKLEYSIVSPK